MLSLFFFLLSGLGCVMTANLIRSEPNKVVDIVHSNIPTFYCPYVSDIMVLLQTITGVAVLDNESVSDFFFIMFVAQIFRIMTMTTTALPPLKNYHDKYRLGGLNGTGTEYIFSGHACYSALTTIYMYKFGIFSTPLLIMYNIVSQGLIIVSRNHYTVDVVLAWIIVPLIYGNFYLCKNDYDCNCVLSKFV